MSHCCRFYDTPRTWSVARDFCVGYGDYNVAINDRMANEFMMATFGSMSSYIRTGAKHDNSENSRGINNDPWDITSWAKINQIPTRKTVFV